MCIRICEYIGQAPVDYTLKGQRILLESGITRAERQSKGGFMLFILNLDNLNFLCT